MPKRRPPPPPRNRRAAPSAAAASLVDRDAFRRVAREYGARWGFDLHVVDADGALLLGKPPCAAADDCARARAFAIREALRWGEPTVGFCPRRRLLWAVPLVLNQTLRGGLATCATERQIFAESGPSLDMRRACAELRELAERENLTNAAALELKRRVYEEEQHRAYAIHSFKGRGNAGLRELYLREEPALFSAIRAGDRGRAREILNRLLVVIHHHAGARLDLVKSFFLELIVSMCRTAVEAGGNPEELLGANFTGMTELSRIDSMETLAPWLARTLEHLMDAIRERRQRDSGVLLFDALAYMEAHCCERISRDDAARAAHLSPSHFSALIRKESGATFTDLLNRMRIERAAERLVRTDQSLALIALETGFEDQSYFTKVFRKYRGLTPLHYRRKFTNAEQEFFRGAPSRPAGPP